MTDDGAGSNHMIRESLTQTVESARQGPAYQGYLAVRERVLDMLEEARERSDKPSDYWFDEVSGFEYILDASPLVIQKLREHCYHLTGLRSYEYRGHHSTQGVLFSKKLRALQDQDEDGMLVREPSELGGFGHQVEGDLVNIDTLKFYECLIALNKAGLLASYRSNEGVGKVVLEIGAGWGGFAYQFKKLCPAVTYIIVDLPQSLLFSAVYLKALFPSARAYVYGDEPAFPQDYESYDFVFLPHYMIDDLRLSRLDLTINMVSFQEMTSEQVERYARMAHELDCPNLYSLNRDRSRYNDQLSTVSSILERYYDVAELEVLDVPYNQLTLTQARESVLQAMKSTVLSPRKALLGLGRVAVRTILARPQHNDSVHTYRHLIGQRRETAVGRGDPSKAVAGTVQQSDVPR